MPQEEEKSSTVKHPTGKTLLVVADDPAQRMLFTETFSRFTPYHVQVVPNSTDAFHFVQHIKPSLFLLDYRLSGMSGIELYDHLHATPGLERIPAIIISGVSSEQLTGEVERRKLILIEKPFDLDNVLSTIATVLSWQVEHT